MTAPVVMAARGLRRDYEVRRGLFARPSTVKAGYNAAHDGFCIQDTQGGYSYYLTGGNGGSNTITAGSCSTVTYTVA